MSLLIYLLLNPISSTTLLLIIFIPAIAIGLVFGVDAYLNWQGSR